MICLRVRANLEDQKMFKSLHKAGLLIFIAAILLSACSAKETEPTVDPDLIYTSAAQTVEAQLTEAAALLPTSTVTAIPPTQTQALPTVAASAPGAMVTSTVLVLPSATTAPAAGGVTAQAKYALLGQSPADQAKIAPGVSFSMVWTVENTGTTTWTPEYTIAFFTGNRLGGGVTAETSYQFGEDVEPGDTINLTIPMVMPNEEGTYYSWWKLKDENGANFGDVDVTLIGTFEVASSGG